MLFFENISWLSISQSLVDVPGLLSLSGISHPLCALPGSRVGVEGGQVGGPLLLDRVWAGHFWVSKSLAARGLLTGALLNSAVIKTPCCCLFFF